MTRTRAVQSRQEAKANLVKALSGVDWESRLSDTWLAVRLVTDGVRHPDYAGSHGTVPALRSDLFYITSEISGPRSADRLAWYLTKRGWYVDESGECDALVWWSSNDEGPSCSERQSLLETAIQGCRVDYLNKPGQHDWLRLPYALVDLGVTHPDFSSDGVDPTGALERDLDEMLDGVDALREFGERAWAEFLAVRGWTVESKEQAA